jgi:hypothetical protein
MARGCVSSAVAALADASASPRYTERESCWSARADSEISATGKRVRIFHTQEVDLTPRQMIVRSPYLSTEVYKWLNFEIFVSAILLKSLVASGQEKLHKIDGWQKIGSVLSQRTVEAA